MTIYLSITKLANLTEDEMIANVDPSDTVYILQETGQRLDKVALFTLWEML